LYRYIPYDPTIRWKDVALPALAAAALWEGAKLVFAWYISNLATLNLVYGSLGTIIALMLWGYISAVILLGGAELAAVMSGARSRAQLGGESRLTSPTPAASP
jgi:membrane protein